MTVGPAPPARSNAVATKYTADLPHPVRCTTSARRRCDDQRVDRRPLVVAQRAPRPGQRRERGLGLRTEVRLVVVTGPWCPGGPTGLVPAPALPGSHGRRDTRAGTAAPVRPGSAPVSGTECRHSATSGPRPRQAGAYGSADARARSAPAARPRRGGGDRRGDASHARRGLLACVAPGAYVDPADSRLHRPEGRHLLRVAATVPRMAPDAVVSHQSAAVLHGLPVWNLPLARVHVTRPRRSAGAAHGAAARRIRRHSKPTRSPWSAGSR